MMRWAQKLTVVLVIVPLGCGHGKRHHYDMLTAAPPVVESLVLIGDFSNGQDRDHPTTTSGPTRTGPVTIRAGLSHSFYTKSTPKHLVLKVDLSARAQTASARPPLNLALVIDRSGSMAEDEKFRYAMEAARLVVENLSDRDIVSLIAFNQTATVLSPAGRAVNPEFLHYRLGQLGPEGNTNLSAGILEAFAQIDTKRIEGQRRQVIVLTDGLANRGITDPDKLERLVSAGRKRGIGLSTLGCGTKFDETVLTKLAGAGGGRYTYVRSSELIPTAIAAELDGLLEVVAQNARLDIRVVPPGKITRVYGRLIDGPTPSYSFRLGDLRDGEQGVFMLEVAPGDFDASGSVKVEAVLTMDNPNTAVRVRSTVHGEAAYSKDATRVRSSRNQSVLVYAGLLDAMEKAEEAIQDLDIERFQQARNMFDGRYEDARRHAVESRDQQLLNQAFLLRHFMAELSAVGESNLLHDHRAARDQLKKDADYRRYLLQHHRRRH